MKYVFPIFTKAIFLICLFTSSSTISFSQFDCTYTVPSTFPNPAGTATAMDEIVARIVYAEIGIFADDDEDVLKAQAVAARTKILNYGSNPNPLSNGVVAYYNGNYSNVPQKFKNAATSTTTEVVLHNGSPIIAEFASRCNGDRTVSYKNGVYSSCTVNTVHGPLPYLISIACSGHSPCSGGSGCCSVDPYPPTGQPGKLFGHGVGLCQYGARDFANQGWCYYNIVHKYYPGTCMANTGIVPAPIPQFASNQDFTPNCNGLNINQSSNTLLVNNLVVENIGDALSDNYQIHYYLSTDDNISNAIYLGQQNQGPIDAFSATNIPSVALNLPNVTPGNYHLMVYIVSDFPGEWSPNIEYDLDNNICLSSLINIQTNPPNTLNCNNITPINCGTLYEGITHFGTPDVSSYSCNSWNETGPENIFSITPTSSGVMDVSLSNTIEIGTNNFVDLDIFILSSCNPNSCLASYNSSGSFSVTANTTYYIIVDGRNGAAGSYQLLVNCSVPDNSSLNCSNAVPFTCVAEYNNISGDYSYSSSTVLGTYDASTYSCQSSWTESGPEVIFEFTPDYSDNIVISLSNTVDPVSGASIDLDAFVLNSCQPNDCLLSIDSGSGILQNAIAGHTYYVVVDGHGGAAGNYELTISANAFTPNNPNNNATIDCSTAIPISCGTSVSGTTVFGSNNICKYECAPAWPMTGREVVYSFTPQYDGNIDLTLSNTIDPVTGEPVLLEVFVLGSCNQDFCDLVVFPGNTTLYAYAGSTYYIVVDGYFGNVGEFELQVECQDAVDLYSQDCVTPSLNENTLSVNYDISNGGNLSASSFAIQWYIIDENESISWPLLATQVSSNIPGNSYNPFNNIILDTDLNQTLQLLNIPTGSYKLGMLIDAYDSVGEIIEFNNSCTSLSTFNYVNEGGCNIADGGISGTFISTHNFHAPNHITVPENGNAFTVANGGVIELSGGNYVDMNPGFIAESGSVFTAFIQDCADNNSLIAENTPQTVVLDKTKTKTTDSIEDMTKLEKQNLSVNGIFPSYTFAVSPNPLSQVATVKYSLDEKSAIEFLLYDLNGQQLETIAERATKNKGIHEFTFSVNNLTNGLYILTMTINDSSASQTIIVTD